MPTSTPPVVKDGADFNWGMVSIDGPAPTQRKDASLVYDEDGHILLLFGGRQGGQPLDDLWSFDIDAGVWTRIEAAGGPDPRWGHVAIFDAFLGQMVVFSGQRPGGFFDDTWVFEIESGQWREAAGDAPRPAARYGSCAGYDSEGGLLYISHGFTASGRFDDTWAYDLEEETWTDVTPGGTRPVERCLHRCSFDPDANYLLLYGGQTNQSPGVLGDLWRYDPSEEAWTELSPGGDIPAARLLPSLARDPELELLLLFGGASRDGRSNDLWSFTEDGGWTQLQASEPPPEARSSPASAFDTLTGTLYIFGGAAETELADLWTLRAE